MKHRPWICLSSSSGETFRALWRGLSSAAQTACLGFFSDRSCPALGVAAELLGSERVYACEKKDVEDRVLAFRKDQGNEPLVLLCGYFGILSPFFLKAVAAPVVNTHPSLLPSFPGLDKKVHARAAETVAVSGFTLHLVTEELDAGPILFQQPVWVDPRLDEEGNRKAVRAAEQGCLPLIWEKILQSDLTFADAGIKSKVLRARLGIIDPLFTTRTS